MKRQGRCKTVPIRQPEEDAEEEVELGEDETEEPPEGGQVQTLTATPRGCIYVNRVQLSGIKHACSPRNNIHKPLNLQKKPMLLIVVVYCCRTSFHHKPVPRSLYITVE